MVTGNTLDVGAVDAEVVQLTVAQCIEFANGLLVGRPLLEGLANVHLFLLSSYTDYIARLLVGLQIQFWQSRLAKCA